MSFEKVTAPHVEDTIVAVSSAPGPGARAIVRVSGPRAREVVAVVFRVQGEASGSARPTPLAPLPLGRGETESRSSCARFDFPNSGSPLPSGRGAGRTTDASTPTPSRRFARGALHLTGVHSPVPATLYFFAGPRSYTGQDVAELHTVGSPPLVERLVSDLLAAGARPARPGEFTMRAFLAGKKDLTQAEAVHAVIEAGTESDLRAALSQMAGGVSRPLDALREDLLNLLADTEAALDFADEDIEFVSAADTVRRLSAAVAQLEAVEGQLDDRTVSGRPVRVALVGAPNAGKSSLFNALAGGAALVSDVPGTTRDYLTRPLNLDGISAELIDTAGWQHAADTIEEQAQRLGGEQAARADVLLWCDEQGAFAPTDAVRLRATGASVLMVRTKYDAAPGPSPLSCSVVVSDGLSALRAAVVEAVRSLARPALAPSQSRCRAHVRSAREQLAEARGQAARGEPPELLALSLRAALDALGELTGAVYTNDLLDRIFSRFCIGK